MSRQILEFSKTMLVRFLPMYLITVKNSEKSGNAIFGQFSL